MVRRRLIAAAVTALVALAQPTEARLVKLSVDQRAPYLGGAEWGDVGPYELLSGTAAMEVDPKDPHDGVIVDVDKAPRNAQGKVEFSTQFLILKPVEMDRGNHEIFYAVNNRGNSLEGLLTATAARRARLESSNPRRDGCL